MEPVCAWKSLDVDFSFFCGFLVFFGCCLTHVLGTCYFEMSLVGFLEFELKMFYLENFGRRLRELWTLFE